MEQKKKQYEEEIKNRNISLEVVWVNKTDGFAEKACFSLTNKKSGKEIPDIYEMSEDAEDCDDQEGIVSYWSYDKEINENVEGLWVRGENSKVRELFKKNWDNFSGSDIINKGKKEYSFSSIEIEELLNKEICKIVEKTNKEVDSWLEIECLISQEHINAKQERNKLRNSYTSSNRRS
ncbi:hypothetical protein MSU_0054 [Mycoplasma suis str. Illinois]|uniref:Uncharacterized protein n=2 Tax=Mycoplasma suis TaxID=57372 RepID=F0QQ28_MYCSL|nr:hypothetical protein MSU_0054 [Mycoplasma suis str. Illinois]